MKNTLIYKRFTSESPKIFKKIVNLCIVAGAIGAAIMAAPATGIVIAPGLMALANNLVVAGIVGAAIAKLTVEDKNDIK